MNKPVIFRAHPDYRKLVQQIGDSFGIHNIEVYATTSCFACATLAKGNRLVISYNPQFIELFSFWGKVAIFAHEVAHIYNNDISRRPRTMWESHWNELNADWFAGWVLYCFGADLSSAQSMYDSYDFKRSPTHPGEPERRISLRHGWNAARNYYKFSNVG